MYLTSQSIPQSPLIRTSQLTSSYLTPHSSLACTSQPPASYLAISPSSYITIHSIPHSPLARSSQLTNSYLTTHWLVPHSSLTRTSHPTAGVSKLTASYLTSLKLVPHSSPYTGRTVPCPHTGIQRYCWLAIESLITTASEKRAVAWPGRVVGSLSGPLAEGAAPCLSVKELPAYSTFCKKRNAYAQTAV